MESANGEPPREVQCTFVIESASVPLFVEARDAIPEPGERVSYDGCDYSVLDAVEQLSSKPEDDEVAGDRRIIVRITPVDGPADRP